MLNAYWTSVLVFAGVGILIAYGLWLPIWAGQLFLAQAGLAAIAAYASAAATIAGIPFPIAVTVGCLGAVVAAVIVGYPTLRLPPLGTAIMTMAAAELIRTFLVNFKATGGGAGLFGIPTNTNLGLVWVTVFVCIFMLSRLTRARIGRAWDALREDETAAEAMGVNLVRYKILAFGGSGLLAGLGGVLYSHYATNIGPDLFGFGMLLQISVYAFLGGRTTYWGPLVGGLVMIFITEWFRFLADWRLLFYGGILVVVMILRPQGLATRDGMQRIEAAIGRLMSTLVGRRPVAETTGVATATSGEGPSS